MTFSAWNFTLFKIVGPISHKFTFLSNFTVLFLLANSLIFPPACIPCMLPCAGGHPYFPGLPDGHWVSLRGARLHQVLRGRGEGSEEVRRGLPREEKQVGTAESPHSGWEEAAAKYLSIHPSSRDLQVEASPEGRRGLRRRPDDPGPRHHPGLGGRVQGGRKEGKETWQGQ